jgi:hypothetical protein
VEGGLQQLRSTVEITGDRLLVCEDVERTDVGCHGEFNDQDEWVAAFVAPIRCGS